MNDISKLPKWAQRHIAKLEDQLAAAQASIAARPDSPVSVMYGISERTPLDQGCGIRFDLNDGRAIAVRLHSRGYVEVSAEHWPIVAQPQASNVLRVNVGEWW